MDRLPDPDTRPTLTIDEARAFVKLSRSAAYAAAASGDLPTIRLGRSLRVPTAALRRLLALDQSTAAAPELSNDAA